MAKTCKHENTIIFPADIRSEGDGVAFNIDENAKFQCQDCDQELPNEDIPHYDKDKMAVGIPKDIVDG